MNSLIVVILILTILNMLFFLIILSKRYKGNIGLFFTFFFIYFWTIHGGWGMVSVDNENGYYNFHYLFDKLFLVEVDKYYVLTLSYYSLFVFVFCVSLFFIKVRIHKRDESRTYQVQIQVKTLILVILILLFTTTFKVYETFVRSLALDVPFYSLIPNSPEWSSGKKYLDAAVTLIYLSLAILASQKRPNIIAFQRNPGYITSCLLVTLGLIVTIAVALLGSKSILLSAFTSGLVFYNINYGESKSGRKFLKIFVIGFLSLIILALVNVIRGLSIGNLSEALGVDGLSTAIRLLIFSNEAFGAHFSMYGVLVNHLQPLPELALLFLADSLIPFDTGYDPLSTYEYYAAGVGANSNQGYSIHYATGFYLNFGIVGFLLSGIPLAFFFAKFFQFSQVRIHTKSKLIHSLAIFGFALFVANVPVFLRGGIEAYRAVFITMALPIFAIMVSLQIARIETCQIKGGEN